MRSRFHRAALLLMAPVLPCLAQAETHTVRIEDMQFVPATITVKAGDRIVWENADLVLTTGGTGPAPRDLTPEAMHLVISKELPGFGELMRSVSLRQVPTAILSRQTAGIRGRTLIINLPGKPEAISVCLSAVFPAVPYCLELIGAQPIRPLART